MPTSRIKEEILRFMREKRSKVSFHDLYAALSKNSEQGIRHAVYRMVENGTIRRVELPEPNIQGRKRAKVLAAFELEENK